MEARPLIDRSGQNRFASTHWTTVRACAGTDEAAWHAREELCRDYWYPVYAHIRRTGCQGCDAEDLTQGFFVNVLSRPWFAHADQSRGRFRSFLLASLDNFLRDQLDRTKRLKRGGGYEHIPYDMGSAEARYAKSGAGSVSPAALYDTEWALAIVAATLKELEGEYASAGKRAVYQHLKCYLTTEGEATLYEATATVLDISTANVTVAVHRLRKRYRACLREKVMQTVTAQEDVEDEMLHLRAVLAAG